MSNVSAQALLQQALQHHQAGRVAPAATLYAQLRKLQPSLFEGYHLGGAAALQLGQLNDALALLGRALQLRPQSGPSWLCLGLAQAQSGKPADAEKALQKATQFEPKNFEAWSNLGSVRVVLGKLDEAAAAYEQSVKARVDYAHGWTGLGSVRQLQGRSAEAIEHHSRALQLDPRHPKAQLARGQARQSLHDVEGALADFEAHLARHADDHEAASLRLCLLNYLAASTAQQLFEEHRRFGERFPTPSLSPRHQMPDTPINARLRLGFLSPDLRDHSVAYFLEPLLRHLDRSEFEIFLYHDHFRVDATSRRLAERADHWKNFIGQSNVAVEAQLRADRLDVLIDLAGHTGMNRMAVFATRVAPVQIAYLGYPNTTGLRTMDYRLTDAEADPLGESDARHTEKLLRFSPSAWAYQPSGDAPNVAPAPCLRSGSVTFGSFNNFSKVNRASLELWARVLAAVPNSRLLLKSFCAAETSLRTRIAEAGLPADRVVLLSANDRTADHLGAYSQIDVALDPFPYHGTTTTCEALWMGVPVVTLSGDRHAARVGRSLLTAVGHPEWIAYSPEDYVRIGSELARDPPRLAQIRARLRADVEASPLLDHAAQARRFAAAIRTAAARKRAPIEDAQSVAR